MSKSEPNRVKICIVVSSLGKGGAEKSAALQSIMLFNAGFSVYIVSILDKIEYEYKGELLNLGLLKNKDDSYYGRFKRLLILKRFLKAQQFNYLIDNRARVQWYREFVITKWVYKLPTIYVIHSFSTKESFTKYNWLNTYLYRNKFFVAVSNEAKNKFKSKFNLKNIRTLHNAFDDKFDKPNINVITTTKLPEKYILYFGRLQENIKNLKFLINCYSKSKLVALGYKLILLGRGPDLCLLKSQVKQLELEQDVFFEPFNANPFTFVKQAYFTVLTSHYEGFPMSIIESLSLGTPVVSVNCKSGPKEIIINKKNGLLVDGYKEENFINAMNQFVLDKVLYNACKMNAKNSVEQFKMQSITNDWVTLINTFKV